MYRLGEQRNNKTNKKMQTNKENNKKNNNNNNNELDSTSTSTTTTTTTFSNVIKNEFQNNNNINNNHHHHNLNDYDDEDEESDDVDYDPLAPMDYDDDDSDSEINSDENFSDEDDDGDDANDENNSSNEYDEQQKKQTYSLMSLSDNDNGDYDGDHSDNDKKIKKSRIEKKQLKYKSRSSMIVPLQQQRQSPVAILATCCSPPASGSSRSSLSVIEVSSDDNNENDNQDDQQFEDAFFHKEDYKRWKKNAPYLYDLIATYELDWPSLTIEFLPNIIRPLNRDYSVHRMVLGTQTSDSAQNFLIIYQVHLPELDPAKLKYTEPNGYGCFTSKTDYYIKIPHFGDVNRARVMPQNSFLIGSQSSNSKIYLFDFSKHSSEPDETTSTCVSATESLATESSRTPEAVLTGHTADGYGLAWNPHTSGVLLSGNNDGKICTWNIEANQTRGRTITPTTTIVGHGGGIGDVRWHHFHSDLFGSVGTDDRRLIIWDQRVDHTSSDGNGKIINNQAHKDDINVLCFNQFNEYPLLTGSADRTIRLWDLRNIQLPLLTLQADHQQDEIYQLNWSSTHESVFASAGADNRVLVWDILGGSGSQSTINSFNNIDSESSLPPELMFIHNGHTDKVMDFAWNPEEPWLIGSVSQNNCLHLWKPGEHCLP